MKVNDIWGIIDIEDKYLNVINSKEFINMKNVTQLGLNTNPNATHTRYQHSLGVYYLACKLIASCKNKLNGIIKINKEDEESIKLMALTHDIGHGPFSHVMEEYLPGTHENNTIHLLEGNTEIHKQIINSFGENVLDKTIKLIKKENIEENSLLFIVSKLLSGGIDIDRIDYIYRDSRHILNETNDFSNLLNEISLECVNNKLEIVFNNDSIYKIVNYFNKRFELYDKIYLDKKSLILEKILGLFLKLTNTNVNWNTKESELKYLFEKYSKSKDIIISRYSKLLINRDIDNSILFKEFNNQESLILFKDKLFRKYPILKEYSDYIFISSSLINIYNKNKKIYINKNGIIDELSNVSDMINSNLKSERYIIGIDLYVLRNIFNLDLNEIENYFKNEVEIEKKYIFNNNSSNPTEEFKLIKEKLKLSNSKYLINSDIYYDNDDILKNMNINVRRREVDGKVEYTIKRIINDQSSVLKRYEINFNSLYEVILFLNKEWNINISKLQEKLKLVTKRCLYNLDIYNGKYEFVFDKTIPYIDGIKYDPDYMIECELLSGNSSGLYFINKELLEFNFIDGTNNSKKDIAFSKLHKVLSLHK